MDRKVHIINYKVYSPVPRLNYRGGLWEQVNLLGGNIFNIPFLITQILFAARTPEMAISA